MISLSDALITNEEVPWRAQSKDYYYAFGLDGSIVKFNTCSLT